MKSEGDTTVFTSGVNLGGSMDAEWFWLGGSKSDFLSDLFIDRQQNVPKQFDAIKIIVLPNSKVGDKMNFLFS